MRRSTRSIAAPPAFVDGGADPAPPRPARSTVLRPALGRDVSRVPDRDRDRVRVCAGSRSGRVHDRVRDRRRPGRGVVKVGLAGEVSLDLALTRLWRLRSGPG